jgi:hypothetical protein
MDRRNQLSPKEAVAYGLLCVVVGGAIMLPAFGAFGTASRTPDAPGWIVVAAGLTFVLGGLALVVIYAIGRASPASGDLPPGTPFAVRISQYALALAITALLGVIASWAAFGPGPRTFSTTIPLLGRSQAGETGGRIAFGIGAVIIWIMAAVMAVIGGRRLFKSDDK